MSSLFRSPKAPPVPQVNIPGDIGKYVSGLGLQLPTIISSEAEYRPQFVGLNLADVGGFMRGTAGQPGLFALSRMAAQAAQAQTTLARSSDIAQMSREAKNMRAAMEALSPEQVQNIRAIEQLAEKARGAEEAYVARMEPYISSQEQYAQMGGKMAEEAFARRDTLSQEEQRAAQQSAREAAMSSGRVGGNLGIAAEILNREQAKSARRAEASNLANIALAQRQGIAGQAQTVEQMRSNLNQLAAQQTGQAYDAAQSFYVNPALGMFGSTPASVAAGQNLINMGLDAIGSATPQLYDISAALGLGASQRQNQLAAATAGVQARAAQNSALFGLGGAALGAYGTMVGGSLAGGATLGAALI